MFFRLSTKSRKVVLQMEITKKQLARILLNFARYKTWIDQYDDILATDNFYDFIDDELVLDVLGLPKDNSTCIPEKDWCDPKNFCRDGWYTRLYDLHTTPEFEKFIDETIADIEKMKKEDWWESVKEANAIFFAEDKT